MNMLPARPASSRPLRPVMDPELNLGIVDLGLLREVEVDAENGHVTSA